MLEARNGSGVVTFIQVVVGQVFDASFPNKPSDDRGSALRHLDVPFSPTPGAKEWPGEALDMFGTKAVDEFVAGFKRGVAGKVSDQWILDLAKKIAADPNGFKLGYAKGVLSGLGEGITGVVSVLIELFKLSMKFSPFGLQVRLAGVALLALTEKGRAEIKKQIESAVDAATEAKRIADVLANTAADMLIHPGDYIVMSGQVGEEVGKWAGAEFTNEFLNKPAPEIGQIIGSVVGQVAFEIILQILLELGTAGVGNAARVGVAAGEATRGGSRIARLVEALKPMLTRLKGIQRLLKELARDERGAAFLTKAAQSFKAIANAPGKVHFTAHAAGSAAGKTRVVEGWLGHVPTNTNSAVHSAVTQGLTDYHAGHLFPARNGGESVFDNLVPMHKTHNLSYVKAVENAVNRHLQNGPAYLKVTVEYGSDPRMPSTITHEFFRKNAAGQMEKIAGGDIITNLEHIPSKSMGKIRDPYTNGPIKPKEWLDPDSKKGLGPHGGH
jgi:hypothetical protein